MQEGVGHLMSYIPEDYTMLSICKKLRVSYLELNYIISDEINAAAVGSE